MTIKRLNPSRPAMTAAYLIVDVDLLEPQGFADSEAEAREEIAEREKWPGEFVVVPLIVSGAGWKKIIAAKVKRARERERDRAQLEAELDRDLKAGKYDYLEEEYKADCDAKNRE